MIYIGIDISSKSFMVHAINEKKKVVFNEEIKPTRGGLKQMIEKLGKQTNRFKHRDMVLLSKESSLFLNLNLCLPGQAFRQKSNVS